jgi:hypothetical protein
MRGQMLKQELETDEFETQFQDQRSEGDVAAEELESLVTALRARTQEMAAASGARTYGLLFKQRQQLYAAIEARPEGAEALRRLFDDADPKIRLNVARHCGYKGINLDAAIETLQGLAARADKIGDDAKACLQIHLPESRVTALPEDRPRRTPPRSIRDLSGHVRRASAPALSIRSL